MWNFVKILSGRVHVLLFILVITVVTSAANVNLEDKVAAMSEIGEHWAILVAGSKGWYNYRHQADVCHAYHILRKHGIPEERIVTLMYDDIAHNIENPTPGIIINRPGGDDVYAGVVIDYKGEDVTPANFLAALQGDEEKLKGVGSGKVIKSGPNDHVFVYFTDHGGPGLVGFPGDDVLYATDLIKSLTQMHVRQQYNQMVLYVEACYAGSIFADLLPNNINILASTAANTDESSEACYPDESLQTYLGDCYSVNWMEDSDVEDLKIETFLKQFEIVRNETIESHVSQYGDMSMMKLHVGEFQGESNDSYVQPNPIRGPKIPSDAVPSPFVPISILHRRLLSAENHAEEKIIRDQIMELLKLNQRVDDKIESIVNLAIRGTRKSRDTIMNAKHQLTTWDCYKPVVESYNQRCFSINKVDQARRRVQVFVNLCEERIPTEKILGVISKLCGTRHNSMQ